eukprot:1356578-Amorphochlora_amoeboformis.AAC.2
MESRTSHVAFTVLVLLIFSGEWLLYQRRNSLRKDSVEEDPIKSHLEELLMLEKDLIDKQIELNKALQDINEKDIKVCTES